MTLDTLAQTIDRWQEEARALLMEVYTIPERRRVVATIHLIKLLSEDLADIIGQIRSEQRDKKGGEP